MAGTTVVAWVGTLLMVVVTAMVMLAVVRERDIDVSAEDVGEVSWAAPRAARASRRAGHRCRRMVVVVGRGVEEQAKLRGDGAFQGGQPRKEACMDQAPGGAVQVLSVTCHHQLLYTS
jgi:hypothetical protein